MILRLFSCLLLLTAALPAQEAALATVHERVISKILTVEPDLGEVKEITQRMRADGTWADLNYKDVSRTGFQHKVHLERLFSMALAYRHPTSALRGDPDLLAHLQLGLQHWTAADYTSANWWYNQIFTPRYLARISLLLTADLPAELLAALDPIIGRAHLQATGARPGGDRMKVGGTLALATLRRGDAAAFRRVMQSLSEQVTFATGVRGIQADYSFHHRVDRVNNTTSYGKGYADNFAEWAAYVAGTPFAFSDASLRMLVDFYLDGIVKQHIFGKYPDTGVLNRSNSRPRTFTPAGISTAVNLLVATDYRADELRKVVDLRSNRPAPIPAFSHFYWQTEHFVCQRPDWYASVRMHSVRNANMEVPYNEEGFYNHHRGDGANHLHLRGDEYLNVWPLYDYQKIPGTTIRQKDTLDPATVQRYGLTTFVGAVTDGYYGAVGYDFISPHDGTKARKAWFFFAEEYLCLGAGIESENWEQPVITTLEQSRSQGPVTVGNADGPRAFSPEKETGDSLSWVHHNNTGYLLAPGQNLRLHRERRSGKWSDINRQWDIPQEPVTAEVFQLWIDHGPRPHGRPGGLNHADMRARNVTYAYTVVPNVGVEELQQRPRQLKVLANTRQMQAATHLATGLTQVIAYAGGTLDLDATTQVHIDSPAALLIARNGTSVRQITVADPGRNTRRLHFSLSGNYAVTSGEHHTTYTKEEDRTYFSILMPSGALAGSSVVLKLK